MRTFLNIGIHARVLIAAIFLISASTFTLGYFGVGIINRFVTLRFNQRIDFMTEYLAMNAELGILIDEQRLLQGLAQGMLDENDIARIQIENTEGRTLVDETRNIRGPFRVTERKVVLSEIEGGYAEMDLILGGGPDGHIGTVKVTYSIRGIRDLIEAMTKRFVVTAIALTLVSGIIFYFISRSLVKPVISLVKTARKVSMGNSSVRARLGTTPETRKLAGAFNDMLDSLAKSRKTVLQAHEKIARQETLAEIGKFSMMIAHEVKNPLGIIKSSVEMMKKDLKIPEDNLALIYAEEELERLNDLIESFLMFSRPAKPKFDIIDLNQMLYQVVIGFEIQYDSENVDIHSAVPSEPFWAEADFDLLSRGISNIIRNAREVTKPGHAIEISVDIKEKKWTLNIRDQGEGVLDENKKKVFEPFFTTKSKGTGLGLAFADQVVKAHGGSIIVENHEQGGAVFSVNLFSNTGDRKIEDAEQDGVFTDR
ncbi:MAG: HAMP domain-containing protein [Desulfobacteraceae bacterium]|nr:HAMP domain-containing protein [Desulfobacteraceae bacterium]